MLCDDVTAVVLDAGGRPVALSGFPAVRLWADTIDELGWEQPRAPGMVHEGGDKYRVPIRRFRDTAAPLRGVFLLRSHNRESIEIEPLAPTDAFVPLALQTYRRRFLAGLGGLAGHLRVIAGTVDHAWLAKVTRPIRPFLLDTLADRIEEHLRAAPAPSRAKRSESG
jgi:hypothetical protein